MSEQTGTFYAVSVGPGDPELLTLQAVRVLENTPVIAAPQTASGQMLALDFARGAVDLTDAGIPCIGIPGTIDNDLAYTEMTLGYETAVQVCTEAIRAIRATSRAHDRPHVVECMGRHCGDIALKAACATGSEIVVVPEVPWSVEEVASRLNKQIAKGNYRSTIVLAEGCWESMAPFDMYGFLTSHGKQ